MPQIDDQSPERKALAALFAALAKSLDSQNPGVGQGFLDNLDQIYREARDWEKPSTGLLETLSWTAQIYRDLK